MADTSIATVQAHAHAVRLVREDIEDQVEQLAELLDEWAAGKSEKIFIIDARDTAAGIVASVEALAALGAPA
jgi:hypothetical protein